MFGFHFFYSLYAGKTRLVKEFEGKHPFCHGKVFILKKSCYFIVIKIKTSYWSCNLKKNSVLHFYPNV